MCINIDIYAHRLFCSIYVLWFYSCIFLADLLRGWAWPGREMESRSPVASAALGDASLSPTRPLLMWGCTSVKPNSERAQRSQQELKLSFLSWVILQAMCFLVKKALGWGIIGNKIDILIFHWPYIWTFLQRTEQRRWRRVIFQINSAVLPC